MTVSRTSSSCSTRWRRRARAESAGRAAESAVAEEREEVLADFAEARATCEWLIERGVEQVATGESVIEAELARLAARHGDPQRLLAPLPPVRAAVKVGRNRGSPAAPAGSTSTAVSTRSNAALGQFASPDPLSPRLAAEPLSSNCHVASALAALNEARSRSPGYPYPLASPTAAARPTSRTPRAARALAPRLLSNCPPTAQHY